MKILAHLMFVALLVVFAAGSVAHVAAGSAMAAKMVTAESGAMGMQDCEPCDVDDDSDLGATCNFVCSVSFVAVLDPHGQLGSEFPPEAFSPARAPSFLGIGSPPQPYPPRILV